MARDRIMKEIGSGITRYRVEGETFDASNPDELRNAIDHSLEFSRDPFRKRFGANVRAAQDRLAEISSEPCDESAMFAEHSGEGWYCQRIDVEYRRALKAASDGAVQRALDHAGKVGWYIAEWCIKFEVEPFALAGMASSAGGARGGRARGQSDKIRDKQAAFIREYRSRLETMDAPTAKQYAARAAGYSVRQASRIIKAATNLDI